MIRIDVYELDPGADNTWKALRKTQEWKNFTDFLVTSRTDDCDSYQSFVDLINYHLKPYNARYNHAHGQVRFHSKKDYFLFKLRYS